jgi:Xaa-Pro aminopeptidase
MEISVNKRVEKLRAYMREHQLDAFIIPSTDPHAGEYVPEHWESRTWISGFDGSAGTAVVTLTQAALWTDSRYFLAAEQQLKDTCFILMRDKLVETPTIPEWLGEILPEGAIVGIDGSVNTTASVAETKAQLERHHLRLNTEHDPFEEVWEGRPAIPENPVHIHPLKYAGEPTHEKLARIRKRLAEEPCAGIIVNRLDDIAWLTNMRGTDVYQSPMFVSYMLITPADATLYINKVKITDEIVAYLKAEGISVKNYEDIVTDLQHYTLPELWVDPLTNYTLIHAIPATCKVILQDSPVSVMKCIKTQAEIDGYHNCMIRDGVALVRFQKWLYAAVPKGGESEYSADMVLTGFRAEQDLFMEKSFNTIAGYGPHGAIVHYHTTKESSIPLEPKGLFMVDSGGHYLDGTTDVTRTYALGPLTDEERKDYTLGLKGTIRLSMVKFPEGSSGTQLDAFARYAMWQEGINYLHGTGHGVGSYLSVHEGPHQFRMNYMPTPLVRDMTITIEPAIYKAGRHGVRIENTNLLVHYKDGEYGPFLEIEPLTLCPIDTAPIIREMMAEDEIEWLNNYHKLVYDKLAPHLNEEERAYLADVTKPIQ